jgi:hypothetical protein
MSTQQKTWTANWVGLWIALASTVLCGCRDETPVPEPPVPSQSTESAAPTSPSIGATGSVEPATESTLNPSESPASSGEAQAEKTNLPQEQPPKAQESVITNDGAREPSSDTQLTVQRSPAEEKAVVLRLASIVGCIGGIVTNDFLREKRTKELFSWFELSPPDYSKKLMEYIRDDTTFREKFDRDRANCSTRYVDLVSYQESACLTYCKKLRVCGGAKAVPSGCVSRCRAWEENPRILRTMACLERPRCSSVMRCLKAVNDRVKMEQRILEKRRRRNAMAPDPERVRLLEAISTVVCPLPERKGDIEAILKVLKTLGFNKESYHASVERFRSDLTFAEDIYERTRACFPTETAPAWPKVKPSAAEKKAVEPSADEPTVPSKSPESSGPTVE